MDALDTLVITLLTTVAFSMILTALHERDLERLEREDQILRRLLLNQASLDEMSLNAYIAMLQEAQWNMGGR